MSWVTSLVLFYLHRRIDSDYKQSDSIMYITYRIILIETESEVPINKMQLTTFEFESISRKRSIGNGVKCSSSSNEVDCVVYHRSTSALPYLPVQRPG